MCRCPEVGAWPPSRHPAPVPRPSRPREPPCSRGHWEAGLAGRWAGFSPPPPSLFLSVLLKVARAFRHSASGLNWTSGQALLISSSCSEKF